MKGISLLILSLLVSCQPATSMRNQSANTTPATKEVPATDAVIVIEEPQEEVIADASKHDLVIEIDQVNHIFTVTGNAGQVCGIQFKVIDRLNYEVLSADQARITLNERILELRRVDKSNQEGIFGDWSMEINEGDLQGNVIFHIRLDPVLKIESSCEAIP